MFERNYTEQEKQMMIDNKVFEAQYMYEAKEQMLWDLKQRTDTAIPEPYTPTGEHFVYGVWVNYDLVYVGQGKGDRWKHPNSGISHNKELNKMFFSGADMDVSFFRQKLSKQDALRLESSLIAFYNPKANKAGKTRMPLLYSDFESPYDCTFDIS